MSGHLEHRVSTSIGEEQYLGLLRDLVLVGDYRSGRNGGTYSAFGRQMAFDLSAGFPLLTTKRVHLKSIIHELLWFISGDTNTAYLNNHGVTIWDEWADEQGELGPVYGAQWRSWPSHEHPDRSGIDQLADVIEGIKTDPYGRRHIVSAWNPDQIDQMALPPCHCLFQFHVSSDGKLSCQLYQRSADVFLGVPFNIASYALLTHMVAHVTGLEVGTFVHTLGDYHLYDDHTDQAVVQMRREVQPFPKLEIMRRVTSIDEFRPDDFAIAGYAPHPAIRAAVRA